MLLYHKNIFGGLGACICSLAWVRPNLQWNFSELKCNKNNCFPQGKWERRFSKTGPLKNWYIRCGNCHGGTPLCFWNFSPFSNKYHCVLDAWECEKRCNPLCCCRIVEYVCFLKFVWDKSKVRWTIRRIFVTLSELNNVCLPLKMDSRMIIFLIDKSHLCWMALIVELDHSPK